MLTLPQMTRRRRQLGALLGSCLALAACSTESDPDAALPASTLDDDDGRDTGDAGSNNGDAGSNNGELGLLAIVSEREAPETSLQYLHLVNDWPEDGKLSYDDALELGSFVNVHAQGNSVFIHQPEDATVRKMVVNSDRSIDQDVTISFAAFGVAGYSGDMVYASKNLAYLVDESAGLIVSWNPESMEIVGSSQIDEGVLVREGHAAQVSRGIALDEVGFVSTSYRNWDTLEYYDTLAIGVFDASQEEPNLEVIEDDRCASSVTTPFDGGDGYVYLVSDAALGFDVLANPHKTEKKLCVLRMKPGSGEFDADFLVDLGKALNSPGFYAAHPMSNGRLLVNVWASDIDAADVADPEDPSWYWNLPPYFEYAIVDLATGKSQPVKGLPRAAIQWSLTLVVDGKNYVQTYDEDNSTELHRVDTDGTVTRVLSNEAGVDVQYAARLSN